jgi:hypothetical protein
LVAAPIQHHRPLSFIDDSGVSILDLPIPLLQSQRFRTIRCFSQFSLSVFLTPFLIQRRFVFLSFLLSSILTSDPAAANSARCTHFDPLYQAQITALWKRQG